MPGANTHREALIAELIGDVQRFFDRLEEMRTGLPADLEAAAEQLRKAVAESTAAVNESGISLSRAIDRQAKEAAKGVQEAAREANKAAAVVKDAFSRLVLLLVVLALLAGIAGGGVVALVLRYADGPAAGHSPGCYLQPPPRS